MSKRLLLINVMRETVGEMSDPERSASLCVPLMRGSQPSLLATHAAGVSEAAEQVVTASQGLAQEAAHLFRPGYLDRACECSVSRAANPRAALFLQRFYPSRQKKRYAAFLRETPVRLCTLQALSLDKERHLELIL